MCMRAFGRAIILTVIFAGLCTGLLAQTNPVPFISDPLVPGVAVPGGQGFTLTVYGAAFVQGSVVNLNGSARVTTFVSPTKVTAAILASDIASARSVLVTVSNPVPGGGTSDAVSFGITTPTTTLSFTRNDIGIVPAFTTVGCSSCAWLDWVCESPNKGPAVAAAAPVAPSRDRKERRLK